MSTAAGPIVPVTTGSEAALFSTFRTTLEVTAGSLLCVERGARVRPHAETGNGARSRAPCRELREGFGVSHKEMRRPIADEGTMALGKPMPACAGMTPSGACVRVARPRETDARLRGHDASRGECARGRRPPKQNAGRGPAFA